MSRPEELRQITENTLHSLIADESLKFKILQKAASSEQNDMSRQKRIIPAFCTVLAFLLIAAFSLNSIRAVPGSEPGELNSFVAGGSDAAVSLFPEDFDPESRDWYKAAAEQGEPDSMFHLAICYNDGLGVEKDPNLMASYLYAAADRGFQPAIDAINKNRIPRPEAN